MTFRAATTTPIRSSAEKALIERARAMDGEAWDEIYALHHPAIFRYVYFRTGNDAAAEEIAADVFLQAVRGIRRYRYRGVALRAWLYRIARNLTADHRGRLARGETTSLPEDSEGLGEQPDFAGNLVDRVTLLSVLGRLTEEQREVVVLRFFEGLPLATVAEVTGRREGAVKSMQHRALLRMRTILEGEA